MSNKTSIVRRAFLFGSSLAVAFFLSATTVLGQTHIFNGDGSGDDILGFETTTGMPPLSTVFVDGTGAATTAPGSNLGGAATDQVLIQKQETGTTNETVRINNVDVGMIDTLTIGGLGANGSTGDEARVQVRGNAGDIQINTLTLGVGGGDSNPGQFLVTNAGSSATIGNVLSGSTDNVNRLQVGNNAAGGLTLSGDIDGLGSTGAPADRLNGIREIDFFIQANDDVTATRVDLSSGGQTLSVDTFRIGSTFNANGTQTASFTLNDNNVVQANAIEVAENGGNTTGGNTNNGTTLGTLTVTNATASAFGTTGENGNITVGRAQANKPEGGISEGTLNVGAGGTLEATNVISLGVATTNVVNLAGAGTLVSEGTLNVNDATALVTAGRLAGAVANTDAVQGGINVGTARMGEGTINLSAGEIQSYGRVYLGGDATDGTDAGTSGTVNISGTGLFTVGVDPNGGGNGINGTTNIDGNATTIDPGNSNFEVGRDGTGFLNLSDNGELVIARGNLVLGQSGADTDDETGTLLATPLGNASRGTITLTNDSIIRVGLTQGTDPISGTELIHDLNFNGGGGDITLSNNSFISVEGTVNTGVNDLDQARNTLMFSDTSSLQVGNNLNGQSSDVTINGDTTDIDLGNSLNLDSASLVTFDFANTSDYDFNFDIGNNVNYSNARLNLNAITSGLDLTSFDGDILLFDVFNGFSGEFENAPTGTVFGAYQLVYDYDSTGFNPGVSNQFTDGGGSSLALVRAVAVPEPGSLALLGICVLGMAARRRRS